MTRILSLAMLSVLLVAPAQAGELFSKHKGDEKRLEPTDDHAVVYVFRPAMLGAAVKTWAFYDEELIGVSKAKAYSVALVPPGTRTFWSKAENTASVDVDVRAGETYYFKQVIKVGLAKARVKMIEIDAAEAERYFKKCSYVEPTDAGRARAAEIAAKRTRRASAD